MRWSSATARAVAGLRDAMATGLNPAWRYATRWQSRMMNPAPREPIRQSLRRGRVGRGVNTTPGEGRADIGRALSRVGEEGDPGQQLPRARRAVREVSAPPPLS